MNDENDRPDEEQDLDRLLRSWHAENTDAARSGRDRLLETVAAERMGVTRGSIERDRNGVLGAFLMPRTGLLAAALFVVVALLVVLVVPSRQNTAFAQVVQIPEGGRLDAFDPEGRLIGPCPLQDTEVEAEISGPIVSVSIRQRYANPYDTPIEAVYTFPMSDRAAVHRMAMTVVHPDGSERVIEGTVEERAVARAIYEQAKSAGRVASLLEQERPNIFTQSVANIEPGAVVTVEIGYLEVLRARDGEYAFEFPTVVGPRYIPGGIGTSSTPLPDGVVPRRGVVLQGPGRIIPATENEGWSPERTFEVLSSDAQRIDRPAITGTDAEPRTDALTVLVRGVVDYGDSSALAPEFFTLYADGFGVVEDRWFLWRNRKDADGGSKVVAEQVPDADRITPMPVRPDVRAGHDLAISVSLDSGGVPIVDLAAPLHEIEERRDGDDRVTVTLADRKTIPNRDFVLRWRLADDAIAESVFTHVAVGDGSELLIPGPPTNEGMKAGGYLTMVLAPPARVEPEEVRSRELVFVLDTSGSMRGFPIEKSKAVVRKAIESMRPNDTFNVITFAGRTQILWESPRPATEENRKAAQGFIDGIQGGGGTEMMDAIRQALVQNAGPLPGPVELANLPADGRMVAIATPYSTIEIGEDERWLVVREGLRIPMTLPVVLPTVKDADPLVELNGRWSTVEGERRYEVVQASFVEETIAPPMRIVVFLTDGYVGNDQAIVQAVRDNARSTRVFSLGVGNSPNRFLLDSMAREGRGAVDYVLLADGADAVVDRLVERLATPVLTDIEVRIEGVAAFDLLPRNPAGLLPDLFDASSILLHARYETPETSVDGAVVISGNTGSGRYERRIPVRFEPSAPAHASIATLWGRAKVDEVLAPHLASVEQRTTPARIRSEVIDLGRRYSLVTPFTSFVAVERSRVVIGGKPRLVTVPVELPEGTDWRGFFGPDCPSSVRGRVLEMTGLSEEELQVDSLESSDPTRSEVSRIRDEGSRHAGRWFAKESRGGRSRGAVAASPPPASSRSLGRNVSTRGGGRPTTEGSVTIAGGGGRGSEALVGGMPGRGAGAVSSEAPSEVPFGSPLESKVVEPDVFVEEDVLDAGMVVDAAADSTEDLDPVAEEGMSPSIDLERLVRVLDRPLLFIALGLPVDEVTGLPTRGLDGRPWFWEDSVEVTILLDDGIDIGGETAKALGLRIEGRSEVAGVELIVARIPIDRIIDLAGQIGIRRVVPTTGS